MKFRFSRNSIFSSLEEVPHLNIVVAIQKVFFFVSINISLYGKEKEMIISYTDDEKIFILE